MALRNDLIMTRMHLYHNFIEIFLYVSFFFQIIFLVKVLVSMRKNCYPAGRSGGDFIGEGNAESACGQRLNRCVCRTIAVLKQLPIYPIDKRVCVQYDDLLPGFYVCVCVRTYKMHVGLCN